MAEPASILLTGASSGIGLACGRQLLEAGYRVIGISRRPAALEDPRYRHQRLDLADLDASARTLDLLRGEFDIHACVHAAGAGSFGSLEQFSVAQIEASIRINLMSAMVISRSLLPLMRRRGSGQLLFIGSESALNAGRKGALYSAAKFGLRGFCQALREDCARDGIRVSLINPGMVRSPFFDALDFAPGADPANAIEPDDVARILLQILESSSDIVIDEINLSPRIKSIDFGKKG